MKLALFPAACLYLVLTCLQPIEGYVLTPTRTGTIRTSASSFSRAATRPQTCSLRPMLLRMSEGAGDQGSHDSEADGDKLPLVPPPTDLGAGKSNNLLPPSASTSNLDFVSELVLGKVPEIGSGDPVDGNPNAGPVSVPVGGETVELGEVVRPMMSMIFTCNVCETRQMRSFTRLAYEKGIVIVTCKECKSKHLIADNLGWYRDWLHKGDQNVQDIMRRKGVEVPRIDGEEARSLYEEWKD